MEKSFLWTTGTSGDGTTTYTQVDWKNIAKILTECQGSEGVAPNYLNLLEGTVTGANTVQIDTGAALVDGKPYHNTAAVSVNIPSAVGGGNTRIDRIVLRATWANYEVRITRIAGVDALSPTAPAITQISETAYDILLYQALVDTGGTVTLTDERVYAGSVIGPGSITATELATDAVETDKIKDLNVTAGKIAADSIDDTKVGNRVPALTRRQGGSATDWDAAGTTTYTPTNVRMQCGTAFSTTSPNVTVTFPTAFSAIPIVLLTGRTYNDIGILNLSSISFDIDNNSAGNTFVHWLAIGPE